MKNENTYICNVCGVNSAENSNIVFIKAHKDGEDVHICTSCIPSVIHGSGMVVKSNSEIKEEFYE